MDNEERSAEVEQLKRIAAGHAVGFVETGMVIGLGTGTTARHAIFLIAERIRTGELRQVIAIPSSLSTEQEARRLGIPLSTLDSHPRIDITIDGADEVDPDLSVIKGGGGALLREKILAQVSQRTVLIADESKLSPRVGTKWPLPVEVLPFAAEPEKRFVESLGALVTLRRGDDGMPFLTDQDNYILDCRFGPISDPWGLASTLEHRAGIIEHGLFLGEVSEIVLAGMSGITCSKRTVEKR